MNDKKYFQSIFSDKSSTKEPQWCPGCGDFIELAALRSALAELAAEDSALHEKAELEVIPGMEDLGIDSKICRTCAKPHYFPRYEPHKTVIDSGIGCAGQMLAYVGANRMKAPHGRTLPMALGLKAVRPDLTVIAQGGDGDAFAIGGGHFLNFAGYDMDLTYLVTNNEVYGLTKGQVSPSSPEWIRTSASPQGPSRRPVNPFALALAGGWSFIGRIARVKLADGTDTNQLCVDVIKEAVRHEGPAIVVFETECPTYNKTKTKEWLAERVKVVGPEHDASSREAAFKLALVPEQDQIPVGIYYRETRPTFHERHGILRPLLGSKPSSDRMLELLKQFS